MAPRTSTPPRIKVNGRVYVQADEARWQPARMNPTTSAVASELDDVQANLEQLNKAFHRTQPQPHMAPLITTTHTPDLLRLATKLRDHAQALVDALQQIK